MNKTEWFPADCRPVHIGDYEVSSSYYPGEIWWSYWNGEFWSSAYRSQDFLQKALGGKGKSPDQKREWRGLKEPS